MFGRSKKDWSHNYVRIEGVDGVYLTDASVMHMMYPRATYWGEKPKPVEVDSTEVGAEVDLSPVARDTTK